MPRAARKTLQEGVADVVATGVDPLDPEGLDTPLDDAAADTIELTVTEEPEVGDTKRGDASERSDTSVRGAVGRLVVELLADPDLSYEAIVDRVRAEHPTAATTVRSVASTACLMRKRGADVPVRRKPSKGA